MQSSDKRGELSNAEVMKKRGSHTDPPTTQNTSFRAHDDEFEIFVAHYRKASGNPTLSRTKFYSDLANKRCRVSIRRDAKIITRTSTRSNTGKRTNRTIRVQIVDKNRITGAKNNMILKYSSLTQLVQAIVAGECAIVYETSKKK